MSKAIGSIDLKSLKVAGEPNKYITMISGSGIRVHEAGAVNTNFTQINSNGMKVYQGGTADSNIVASFGDTAQIGKSGTGHTYISSAGMKVYGSDGTVELANIGYGSGNSSSGTANAPYYTLGTRTSTADAYNSSSTYCVGDTCTYNSVLYVCISNITTAESWTSSHWKRVIGNYSTIEGNDLVAAGAYSTASGAHTRAIGDWSHAEGEYSVALGHRSHAENGGGVSLASATIAEGISSHAEGGSTKAIGQYSHSEGNDTRAEGQSSHVEGNSSWAIGATSHAQNEGTRANKKAQTVIGSYNAVDYSTTTTHPSGTADYGEYAFIIGNGTITTRSNALTVDWGGNIKSQGALTVQSHSSPIGTVKYASLPSAKSVPTSTSSTTNAVKLCEINLDAGTWMITCGVRWATNATGWRRCNLTNTTPATDIQLQCSAVSGSSTQMVFSTIREISSNNTPLYLHGAHLAGSNLNADAGGTNWGTYITAVRIA